MGNVLPELSSRKCIITVKDISIDPSNIYDMGFVTLTADGIDMASGTELEDIKIEVPKEMIEKSKCVKGAKFKATLMKSDGYNVYSIVPEIK